MPSRLIAVIAVVLLLGLGWSVREASTAQQAVEAELTKVRQEISQRKDNLAKVRQREHAADQALAATQAEVTAASAAAAAATRKQGAAGTAAPKLHRSQTPEVKLGFEYLARHPDLKRALVERSRARVASWYSPLYGVMSLTAEQQQKLENLLLEEQGVYGRLPEGPYALLPGTGMEPAELEEQLQALLGAEKYDQFRNVAHTIQARRVATDLATDAWRAGAPLTDDQINAVIRVVAQATAPTSRSGPNYGGLNIASLAGQLTTVLSPVQLRPLVDMDAQQQLNRALTAADRKKPGP